MDAQMKELIAIGASAAVNCHPCIEHHLAECRRLGLDEAEIRAATDVGMAVGRGAAGKTRAKLDSLLGIPTANAEGGGGCGCAA